MKNCSYYGFLACPQQANSKNTTKAPVYCEKCSYSWTESSMNYNSSNLKYRVYEFLSECEKHLRMKKCPKCQTFINKNRGCSHMKCLVCDYNFCWICTREYSNHNFKKCVLFTTMKWSPLITLAFTAGYLLGFHLILWKYFFHLISLTVKFCAQNLLLFLIYLC